MSKVDGKCFIFLHQDYYLMYHETIPTAQLVYRVALVMQEYTQSGGVSIVLRVISS